MSGFVHTNPVVKQWQVVSLHTGAEVVVDAVGPRDAAYSLAGWQPYENRGGWLYVNGWKVNTVPVSALGLRRVTVEAEGQERRTR